MAPTPEGVRGEAARAIRGKGHGGFFHADGASSDDRGSAFVNRARSPHPGLAKQRIQADRRTSVVFQKRRVAVDAQIGLSRKRSATSFQASLADPSHAESQDTLA
jgi:hypothetical protein